MANLDINSIVKDAPTRDEAFELVDSELRDTILELVKSIDRNESKTGGVETFAIITAESEVFHYVRNGQVEQLLRIDVPPLDSFAASLDADGTSVSPVRRIKNMLVSLNSICLHAAVEAGVSMRMVSGVGRQLVSRVEACASEIELISLASSLLIPLSYCLLVHQLSFPTISDKDILKAIRFVHDHHQEKITVSELAEHVGLSPEYFSAKFKRETGMTVSSYISYARISEAKALLRFTDLSIGEIAAQLSFSSQSYFQTAFKREAGITPQQYRRSFDGGDDPTP